MGDYIPVPSNVSNEFSCYQLVSITGTEYLICALTEC